MSTSLLMVGVLTVLCPTQHLRASEDNTAEKPVLTCDQWSTRRVVQPLWGRGGGGNHYGEVGGREVRRQEIQL